jgi:hypothetical protein
MKTRDDGANAKRNFENNPKRSMRPTQIWLVVQCEFQFLTQQRRSGADQLILKPAVSEPSRLVAERPVPAVPFNGAAASCPRLVFN